MSFWKRVMAYLQGEALDEEIGTLAENLTVQVLPSEIRAGQQVEVRYSGPLTAKGVPVYVHYGESEPGGPWRRVEEEPMYCRSDGVCTAILRLDDTPGQLNLCFRNEHGEWDNNNGENWTFPYGPAD